jgi:hypothetical protein
MREDKMLRLLLFAILPHCSHIYVTLCNTKLGRGRRLILGPLTDWNIMSWVCASCPDYRPLC